MKEFFNFSQKLLLAFIALLCANSFVLAQNPDLIHKGIPDLKDFKEIYRDTTEFIAPTTIIVKKDSILDPLRVVTNKFGKNWFIFATAGAHTFIGDYSNLGPFKGTISPDFSIGVGKWFTPGIGLKVEYMPYSDSRGYTAYKSGHWGYGDPVYGPDGKFLYRKFKTGWWDLSASVILNLSRLFMGYEGLGNRKLMNQFMFTAGVGMVAHTGFKDSYGSQHEISAHTEFQYSRFFTKSKKISLDLKVRGIFYQTNFDSEFGYEDYAAQKIDCNIGLDLGFTWYLGTKRNNGWSQSTTALYQRDFRERDILVVREKDIIVESGKTEQGTITFYVFYPNNYSGRNDAPVVPEAEVNTIDYLAGGLYTQKRYVNTSEATARILNNNSLNGLKTEDIPTELAEELSFATYLPRGYEMSDSIPLSLSLDPANMTEFREKEGFYYAPIYDGQHTWQYRIDDATQGQTLISNANYAETKTYGLNSHSGLDIIRNNMKIDGNDELVSFADFYAAINGNEGYISQFTDEATVNKIKNILENGVITMIQSEGMATSQDNYTGLNASQVGIERNNALSENRANSVMKWLQENQNMADALYQSFFTNGQNTINKVTDESTRGLNAKLNRGVKVRIHYLKK